VDCLNRKSRMTSARIPSRNSGKTKKACVDFWRSRYTLCQNRRVCVRPPILHPPSELAGVQDRPLFGVCSRESLPEPLSLCVGSLYTLTHPRNLSRESVLYCWLGKTECPIIVEPCYAVASVCHQFWEARVCVSSGLLWSRSA
jgi:hypothetical protein